MSALPGRAERQVLIVEDHPLFSEALDLALTVEGYDVRRSRFPPNAVPSGRLWPRPSSRSRGGAARPRPRPVRRRGAPDRAHRPGRLTSSWSRARWTRHGGGNLQAGARKVLAKSQPLDDILATVRRINAGLPVMDRVEREELIRSRPRCGRSSRGARAVHSSPTARTAVLGHLMKGRRVREIAGRSIVSEATVRTQVKSILAKLEVSSQLAAVGMAHEIGWRAPVA